MKKNKIEIHLVILLILLFTFRGSVPFFKYPFIVLFFGLLVYSFRPIRDLLKTTHLSDLIFNYGIISLSVVFFVYSFFITDKVYLAVFKDLMNILFLFSIYLLMSAFIKNLKDLSSFVKYLVKLIIFFAVIISIYEIGNDFYIFSGQNLSFKIDYNFAILPVIFGMIGLLYYLIGKKSVVNALSYGLVLTLFSLSIFLSGSRRGLIILSLIIIFLIASQVQIIFNKKLDYIKLKTTLLYFFISILSVILLSYVFINYTSFSFKNRALISIGSKNLPGVKEKTAFSVLRYAEAFNHNTKFEDIYNLIWPPPIFDPKDPESGWGSRNHKTIFLLTGDNVEIVPTEAKGYLMDSTCNGDTWSENSYSFSRLFKQNVGDSDLVEFSVFCYVSNDFNGDWVKIVMSNDNLSWITADTYNFKKLGSWQKLSVSTSTKRNNVSLFLYFCKNGVLNFKTLKGYVIFAYPYCKITSGKDSVLTKTSLSNYRTNINQIIADGEYKFGIIKSLDLYAFNEGSILNLSNYSSIKLPPKIKENDPIRKWVSKIISEDTTYFGYTADIKIDTAQKNFTSSRIDRWKFAWKIFTKEYNWSKRIFGGGFNYLNWYGYYFYADKTRSDYPHNPFLSVLLYSGLIGLIFYLVLMYKVFYYYIKYFKEYKILSVFFLIAFYFSFFSAGSPFDPPVMGFFVILPFFINSIHEKNKPRLFDEHTS